MRMLHGLMELAVAFEEAAVIHHEALVVGAGMASIILEEKVLATFGDVTKLAPLAQATQDDRTAKGFTPNDPLLRDGSLLKASIERGHEGTSAGVGSAEPVMKYSEQGYVNARTGTSVPPRPVFKIAMHESKDEIGEIVHEALSATFSGRGSVMLKP